MLRTVKAQQDIQHAPTVQTNSGKGGYQKRGRRLYGPDLRNQCAADRSGADAGLWKAWNDEAVPPFPQPLETARERRFPHPHRTATGFINKDLYCHFYLAEVETI